MKNMSAQAKKYLGMEGAELTALAAGGALVPVVNGLAGKFAPTAVAKISEFVGPQAVGSVLPIVGGLILNAIAEHGVKSGQAHKGLKLAGEGLAAAGVIGLAISLSQRYLAPALGMAGINFTPGMRGMGIMPTMGDIRYTPKALSGMGIMPTMGDIRYTPGMNGPDFGRSPNYGGGGGSSEARTSRADFGANFSEDSEAEGLYEDENSYSSSMN